MRMQKLVSINDVEINVSVTDWRDAVIKSGTILMNNGYVTGEYVNAMVQTVENLGPYIVAAPGVAMPHARSTNGVLKSGISIMTLSNSVEFGNKNHDPVYLLIGLAGINDDIHLKIMQTIATIFEDDTMLKRITSCQNKAAIAEIFNNVEVDE